MIRLIALPLFICAFASTAQMTPPMPLSSIHHPSSLVPAPLSPAVVKKIKARQAAAGAKHQMVPLVSLPSNAVRAEATAKSSLAVALPPPAPPKQWYLTVYNYVFMNELNVVEYSPSLSPPNWQFLCWGNQTVFPVSLTGNEGYFRVYVTNTLGHVRIGNYSQICGYANVVMQARTNSFSQ